MANLCQGCDRSAGGGVGMFARVWVERATQKIRFGPDRKAVSRELTDHIEDIQDRYMAQGLTSYEAEQRAVEDMGNPEAISEELGRLHKPYLGWLWRLSQWVLGITAVMAAFIVIPYLLSLRSAQPAYRPQLPETTEIWTYADGTQRASTLLASWEPEGRANLGQYRFTVPLVWLTRNESWTAPGGTVYPESYELTLVLRASTWRFWEPASASQYMFLSNEATDSGGNRYGRWEQGLFSQETHRSYFCNTFDGGTGTVYYELYLDLPTAEAPDWLELPAGFGGHILRVDLSKEEVSVP